MITFNLVRIIRRIVSQFKKKRYENDIISALKIIGPEKIIFCDVGARDDIPYPWGMLEKQGAVKVIGFEPDEAENNLLCQKFIDRKYYNKLVGEFDGTQKLLNISINPSQSSVHPPNVDYIKNTYLEDNWKTRSTATQVMLDATCLDAIEDDIDFIKIDTQGYELEVLKGASKKLDKNLGVLAETWNDQIHSGQALMHDVLSNLDKKKYKLFHLKSGNWKRKNFEKFFGSRGSPVWCEILLFKTDAIDQISLRKLAFLACVYGYPNFACTILQNLGANDEAKELGKLFQPYKLFNKNLLFPYWPELHQ